MSAALEAPAAIWSRLRAGTGLPGPLVDSGIAWRGWLLGRNRYSVNIEGDEIAVTVAPRDAGSSCNRERPLICDGIEHLGVVMAKIHEAELDAALGPGRGRPELEWMVPGQGRARS